MSTSNNGGQKISWKFSTPLKAEYLNYAMSGLHTMGLVTEPTFYVSNTNGGDGVAPTQAKVMIGRFTAFVPPSDVKESVTVGGFNAVFNAVKITTTESVTVNIDTTIKAIGLRYTFYEDGVTPQSEWYADFLPLTQEQISEFDGVIIASVCYIQHDGSDTSLKYFYVNTNGAMKSDVLLRHNGWDPSWYLSMTPLGEYNNAGHRMNSLTNALYLRSWNFRISTVGNFFSYRPALNSSFSSEFENDLMGMTIPTFDVFNESCLIVITAQGLRVAMKTIGSVRTFKDYKGDGIPIAFLTASKAYLKGAMNQLTIYPVRQMPFMTQYYYAGNIPLSKTSDRATEATFKNLTVAKDSNGLGGDLSVAKDLTVSGKINNRTLADACEKSVDTSITSGTSSTSLPTSKAVSDLISSTNRLEFGGILNVQAGDEVSSGSFVEISVTRSRDVLYIVNDTTSLERILAECEDRCAYDIYCLKSDNTWKIIHVNSTSSLIIEQHLYVGDKISLFIVQSHKN